MPQYPPIDLNPATVVLLPMSSFPHQQNVTGKAHPNRVQRRKQIQTATQRLDTPVGRIRHGYKAQPLNPTRRISTQLPRTIRRPRQLQKSAKAQSEQYSEERQC